MLELEGPAVPYPLPGAAAFYLPPDVPRGLGAAHREGQWRWWELWARGHGEMGAAELGEQ